MTGRISDKVQGSVACHPRESGDPEYLAGDPRLCGDDSPFSTVSIQIIGAGLAGVEAAWGLANRGFKVTLFEAKPKWFSPAHSSQNFAELICSNSLKSEEEGSASALLKEEMRALGSIVLQAADATKVPAGKALAVDRDAFSKFITDKINSHPNIKVVNEVVAELALPKLGKASSEGGPASGGSFATTPIIIATGPLSHPSLIENLHPLLHNPEPITHNPQPRTHNSQLRTLYFYDAIAPIIEANSIDMNIAFRASRYDVGKNEEGDYINCPLSRDEYYSFIDDLLTSQKIAAREFEDIKCFESCMPIEVMAARDKDALRFGPMKPIGLNDSHTNARPFAVVQLRQENLHGTLFNMVGFQTRMKYPEQERVFRKIPALANAEFSRLGSMHRNTYINGPLLLDEHLQLRSHPGIYFAGQLTGIEGYLESAATGLYIAYLLTKNVVAKFTLPELGRASSKGGPASGGSSATTLHPQPATRQPINPPTHNPELRTHNPQPRTQNAFPPTTAIGALIHHIAHADPKNYQPMKMMWGLFPPLEDHPSTSRGPKREERRKLHLARARQDFKLFAG